jgi:hypothetical protein
MILSYIIFFTQMKKINSINLTFLVEFSSQYVALTNFKFTF